MPILQQPEAHVGNAFSLFIDEGEFASDETRAFFASFIGTFAQWAARTMLKKTSVT